MDVSIFLVFSSFQLAVYKSLINAGCLGDLKVILVLDSRCARLERPKAEYEFFLDLVDGGGAKDQIKNLYRSRQLFNQLTKLIKRKNLQVKSFNFPHVEGFLSNWLFLRFKANTQCTLNSLGDGVLSYYEYKPVFKKIFLKKVMSACVLKRFFIVQSDIIRIKDDAVSEHYVFAFPDLSVCPEKTTVLPCPKEQKVSSNDVLIIGQEVYAGSFGLDWYLDSCRKIIGFFSGRNIAYRPHPRTAISSEVKRLCDEYDIRYELGQGISLEDEVEKMGSIPVFASFNSSSLFLMKLKYGDTAECYSFSSLLENFNHNDVLGKLMIRSGVKVV